MKMGSDRVTAVIAGSLFLVAMFASLVGGGLLEAVLNSKDYLAHLDTNSAPLWTGVSLELLNGIAVAGIAIVFYPVLKRQNETLAIGYVGFRVLESVFCVLAAVIPLFLLSLGRDYINEMATAGAGYQVVADLLVSIRTQLSGLLIPVFFGLGALILYSSMYLSRIVPRFISVWGIIGVLLVLSLNLFTLPPGLAIVLALPIILNEIFLGGWLIVKGFGPSAIAAG
jgi:hypothetical protein